MRQPSYSKIYRIIHWAMAIAFLLLLLTIFLRMNWMNKYSMAAIVQEHLKDLGRPPLSTEEAKALGKSLRYPMWHWHFILGYILTGLIALRFILPVFGIIKFQNPLQKSLCIKEKIQRWIYLLFYGLVALSLLTGFVVLFLPKTYKHPAVDFHKWSIYYLGGYIILHLASVLWAEFTSSKGLISRMINGSSKPLSRENSTKSSSYSKKSA